jgi:hypothetical protein
MTELKLGMKQGLQGQTRAQRVGNFKKKAFYCAKDAGVKFQGYR